MKQEEEAADIEGCDDVKEIKPQPNGHVGPAVTGLADTETDEDASWADDEPDDDVRGWKMKVTIICEDDDL
jgi:COMPASS component SWD1